MEHAGHELQTILDAVIDLLEQNLVAIKCCLEMAFVPLPLDGHSEDIGRSLQERDVVLAELAVRSAIDLQYPEGRTVALQDDVHGTANAVLDEKLWSSEPFLVFKVI